MKKNKKLFKHFIYYKSDCFDATSNIIIKLYKVFPGICCVRQLLYSSGSDYIDEIIADTSAIVVNDIMQSYADSFYIPHAKCIAGKTLFDSDYTV